MRANPEKKPGHGKNFGRQACAGLRKNFEQNPGSAGEPDSSGRAGNSLALLVTLSRRRPPSLTPFIKEGGLATVSPPNRFSDGENACGEVPGNSAVEVVPTPKENIVLMPYFLKKKHFKRIQTVQFSGPANCAKRDNLPYPGKPGSVRCPLWSKIRRVSWQGEKDDLFRRENDESATAGPSGGHRGDPGRDRYGSDRGFFFVGGPDLLWHQRHITFKNNDTLVGEGGKARDLSWLRLLSRSSPAP